MSDSEGLHNQAIVVKHNMCITPLGPLVPMLQTRSSACLVSTEYCSSNENNLGAGLTFKDMSYDLLVFLIHCLTSLIVDLSLDQWLFKNLIASNNLEHRPLQNLHYYNINAQQ